MVTTKHLCDVCQRAYDSIEMAKKCEAQQIQFGNISSGFIFDYLSDPASDSYAVILSKTLPSETHNQVYNIIVLSKGFLKKEYNSHWTHISEINGHLVTDFFYIKNISDEEFNSIKEDVRRWVYEHKNQFSGRVHALTDERIDDNLTLTNRLS